MKYKQILVTGGAGFVGSNLCLKFKKRYRDIEITALDNLKRCGSELNLPRLKKAGVKFLHGDVRNKEDLDLPEIDLIIECSAEPSVMAGVTSSPEYLLNTNLVGAINCFELARKNRADLVFLSTSRVYPIEKINKLKFTEKETRFDLNEKQMMKGALGRGISEQFSLNGARSLYGTTKLSAELILQEYIENYSIRGIINRCGVISGPWQMGKVDQGVVVLWMARHVFQKPLSYIGYGGTGKQVRDIIHIDDLFSLLKIQLSNIEKFNGQIFNVGGGRKNSVSLLELTRYCQEISGNKIKIDSTKETRPGDIRIYISDCTRVRSRTGWRPKKNVKQTLADIYQWIIENKDELEPILA